MFSSRTLALPLIRRHAPRCRGVHFPRRHHQVAHLLGVAGLSAGMNDAEMPRVDDFDLARIRSSQRRVRVSGRKISYLKVRAVSAARVALEEFDLVDPCRPRSR